MLQLRNLIYRLTATIVIIFLLLFRYYFLPLLFLLLSRYYYRSMFILVLTISIIISLFSLSSLRYMYISYRL